MLYLEKQVGKWLWHKKVNIYNKGDSGNAEGPEGQLKVQLMSVGNIFPRSLKIKTSGLPLPDH